MSDNFKIGGPYRAYATVACQRHLNQTQREIFDDPDFLSMEDISILHQKPECGCTQCYHTPLPPLGDKEVYYRLLWFCPMEE